MIVYLKHIWESEKKCPFTKIKIKICSPIILKKFVDSKKCLLSQKMLMNMKLVHIFKKIVNKTNVHDFFEKNKKLKKNVCRFEKLFTDSKVFYV